MITFAIEKITCEKTGQQLDAVVKNDNGVKEEWCTILDLDRLFDACVHRWGSNWNLDKVIMAIADSEVE